MRIDSLNNVVIFLLLAFAAVASAADKAEKRQRGNKERRLRADHRDLQYFTSIQTAAALPQEAEAFPQQAAEADPQVAVTVESALETPASEESSEQLPLTTSAKADIGLRFNKFEMLNDSDEKPDLSEDDYPLSKEMAHKLSYDSSAFSVVTDDDVRMKNDDVKHYIEKVGGLPPRPTKNMNDPYWQEFKIVIKRVRDRQLGKLPPSGAFRPPRLWENLNATEVAMAVHDEV